MRELLARLRDWFRRDTLDAELKEELRFHQRQLENDALARGHDADTAGRLARRRLGNTTQTVESARQRWSLPWLEHLQQDFRYALRGLRRTPGFTASVVLTLGLGIGANAAMFGVIDELMLRPHPYLRDPAAVHRVYLAYTYRDREIVNASLEYTRYVDLQQAGSAFTHYAAMFPHVSAVGTGDAARERRIAPVSASFWSFFDAPPALGRYFTEAEDRTPIGERVAVLSHEFWLSEYGGRDVIGEPLQVANVPCTIIGVAPRGFVGITENDPPVVYLPITTWAGSRTDEDGTEYFQNYNWGWMEMMVRRGEGVSRDAVTTALTDAYVRSWNKQREMSPTLARSEVARPRAIVGAAKLAAGPEAGLEARTALWVAGVAVVVLLIACANVANLFLARAVSRRRETALRLALGVTRKRLVGQSLTESIVLSMLGCAAGVAIAHWGSSALRGIFATGATAPEGFTNVRTLGVAVAAALFAAAITGVVPVFGAGRPDLIGALKSGAREGTYQRSRVRTAMLVAQAALSVVLLVGAGLFVRSLHEVRNMRLGFDADSVLFARRNLRGMTLTGDEHVALGRRLLAAAQATPGVTHAAWVSSVPFWSTSITSLYVEGIDSVSQLGNFTYQTATTDYFAAMGTRIVRGRPFEPHDRAGSARVAVVSESMAHALWPGRDAIGQCMRVRADTMPCTTVVGVAEDVVQRSLVDEEPFRYYLPIDQDRPAAGFALMIRVSGDPARLVEPLRRVLQAEMPGQSYVVVQPLGDLVDQRRRSWQLGASMFVAFGVLALVVAAVGLYGVIAYNVTQRMHELGVRVALGAQTRDIVQLVARQGLTFATAGVVGGSALALLASRWMQPLLFGHSARDPAVYALVAAVLCVVGLLASSVPALRAARADPNAALRAE